jgi:hypothetical protein
LRDELRFHPLAALLEIREVFAFRHVVRASFRQKKRRDLWAAPGFLKALTYTSIISYWKGLMGHFCKFIWVVL